MIRKGRCGEIDYLFRVTDIGQGYYLAAVLLAVFLFLVLHRLPAGIWSSSGSRQALAKGILWQRSSTAAAVR